MKHTCISKKKITESQVGLHTQTQARAHTVMYLYRQLITHRARYWGKGL